MPPRFARPNAPRISQNTAQARGQMPEPAQIAIAENSAQGVVNRADEGDAINCREPERHGRFFLHPIRFRLLLHAEKMHRGTAAFLHKAPERLDVIVMDTASVD